MKTLFKFSFVVAIFIAHCTTNLCAQTLKVGREFKLTDGKEYTIPEDVIFWSIKAKNVSGSSFTIKFANTEAFCKNEHLTINVKNCINNQKISASFSASLPLEIGTSETFTIKIHYGDVVVSEYPY